MKKVKRIVRDMAQHWVGDGFPVRSLFSYADGNEFDPFLLLDYAGPHEFAPDEAKRGVGEHPHRGFETVTILYQGELEHRDSSGSHGTLGPGDVQWMTAASGIVHEEYHSRKFAREGGTLEMVQLWVNLPANAKKSPPKYQDLLASQIPHVSLPNDAGSARVIAGELYGTKGPAETSSPINLWDVRLKSGIAIDLPIPHGHSSLLVIQQGNANVDGMAIKPVELVLFETESDTIRVIAECESQLLVLSGEPLGEPVVGQGPFVMNTRQEIYEAIADYKAGKMGRLQ